MQVHLGKAYIRILYASTGSAPFHAQLYNLTMIIQYMVHNVVVFNLYRH